MELTAFAQWLNTAFSGFDYAILQFFHELALAADPVVRPLALLLHVIGDGGIFSFLLAALFLLFPKTRRAGVGIILAVAIGAIFTNLTIKLMVARPRPFAIDPVFRSWWEFIGAPAQGEFSFPSGHATAAMASMTAVCLCLRKKWYVICPAMLYALLMGASRNYLMVHYPTDVIGGILVGAVAGTVAFFIARKLWLLAERNESKPFCRFLLYANVKNLGKKKTEES